MAAEDIGSIYTTKIPGYEDAADIQDALKLYHYGTSTVPTTESAIVANSIAGHLKALSTRVTAQESLGVGSEYGTVKPTSPVEGFVWVDANSTAESTSVPVTASYQTSQPTTGLIQGMLWVDSDSSPLKMYIYSGTAWREIGA